MLLEMLRGCTLAELKPVVGVSLGDDLAASTVLLFDGPSKRTFLLFDLQAALYTPRE